MQIHESIAEWLEVRATLTGTVGFVPTMGALHDGHASLLRRSVAENERTVASIYINPTQFDDPEDLANYPAVVADDLSLCEALGVDHVLMPAREEIYADGYRYRVEETANSAASSAAPTGPAISPAC